MTVSVAVIPAVTIVILVVVVVVTLTSMNVHMFYRTCVKIHIVHNIHILRRSTCKPDIRSGRPAGLGWGAARRRRCSGAPGSPARGGRRPLSVLDFVVFWLVCITSFVWFWLVLVGDLFSRTVRRQYSQSPYSDSGFLRVWLKLNLNIKGWNSHVHREFPGKLESSNLSREIHSREIGRNSNGSTSDSIFFLVRKAEGHDHIPWASYLRTLSGTSSSSGKLFGP